MTNQTSQTNNFWSVIRENWVFILVLVSIITTWANFVSADNQADERLNSLEAKNVSIEKNQSDILTQLSQIQTDLQWIKLNLNNK